MEHGNNQIVQWSIELGANELFGGFQTFAQALMNECFNYGEIKCTEQQRVEICIQLGEILDVDYQAVCNDRMLSLLTIEEAKQLSKFIRFVFSCTVLISSVISSIVINTPAGVPVP